MNPELIGGWLHATCVTCRREIKLEVTRNAPLWETVDHNPRSRLSEFRCPEVKVPNNSGLLMHTPEFP